MSLVGAKVLRKEDPNLITGKGRFVDDIEPTGCAFMKFVGSTEAHARVVSIDVSEAEEMPGVLAVYTAADFADYPDIPGSPPGLERPILARNKVHWVGEPVVMIVAEDRYAASDAADVVLITYDPLPAVTDIESAAAEGAPVLFDEVGSNVIVAVPTDDDLEKELEACDQRASLHMLNQRCVAVAIEPSTCIADWGPSGLSVWAAFQAPHHLRNYLTAWLDIPQHNCRVVAPDVGGGFGSKIVWYPELFLAPLASKWLDRPVKFVPTRSEAMLQMCHGRDQVLDVDVGFSNDGHIKALRLVVSQNLGGYPDPTGMGLATLTTWMAAGAYKIPKVSTSFRNVATNTTPIAAYRGAGRPEAAYAIERAADLVADRTGLDPTEVRRRNFLQPGDFPYETHNEPVVYDSADFPAAQDECERLLDYAQLKVERDRRNADPNERLMGIGFSAWLEIAGFGPNGSLEGFGHLGSWESAEVEMQPDGSAIISVGSSPHGQGHETTFAQIASDQLGVPYDRITVRHGDTESIPQGIGTMGSRGVPTAGEGVKNACDRVLGRAKKIAAHMLEANELDIEVADNAFGVRGSPGKSVSWGDVAWASYQPLQLPEELQTGSLTERLFQESPNFSYPSGCYAAVVGIDRDTGEVEVEKYVLVDDCGTVISPLLAEGQVHGGAAQGISQALYEAMTYDEVGQPQTATLVDYLVPSAPDLPGFVAGRVVTPCPNNSLGAKGIGESGAVGSPPAVVNAVVDALSGHGVEHVDMPVTAEKVWRLMQEGASR